MPSDADRPAVFPCVLGTEVEGIDRCCVALRVAGAADRCTLAASLYAALQLAMLQWFAFGLFLVKYIRFLFGCYRYALFQVAPNSQARMERFQRAGRPQQSRTGCSQI